MKKSLLLINTLALVLGTIGIAAAQAPHETEMRFECPNASGGTASERLTNYGSYIAGMGELNVNGVKVSLPVYKGIPGAGVPLNLGCYDHAGTLYNSKTGRVTCLYTHNKLPSDASAVKPPFNVSYVATNAKGGFITKSSNSKITIVVGQGLAS